MKKSKEFIKLCEKHCVKPDNIPEIMTVEDAFKDRGIDIKKMPVVSGLPKRFRRWLIACYKTAVVVEALNADENGNPWIPNYNNPNEPKYEIWFKVKADAKRSSGFGLSCLVCDFWFTDSDVPARLCFRTPELTEYAAKQFTELWTEVQLFLE